MSRTLRYALFAATCAAILSVGVTLAWARVVKIFTNCDGTFDCADHVQPGYPGGTSCYLTAGSGPTCGSASTTNDCVIDGSQYGYFPCTGKIAVWDPVRQIWVLLAADCIFYWPNCGTVPHS